MRNRDDRRQKEDFGLAHEESGGRQPDSGDPIVRDGMGALWKRDLWENWEPAAHTERVHVGNSLPKDARATILPGGSGRVSRGEIPEIPDPIWSIARDRLESPKEGLYELRQLYSDTNNLTPANLLAISKWAAYLVDPEFAMEALENNVRMLARTIQILWLPLFKKVRQLPRFKEFVREIGLVDYWNKFGWPEFCKPLENGDFEFD